MNERLEGLSIWFLLRLFFSRGRSVSCLLVSGSSKAQGSLRRPKLPAAWGMVPEYCSCMMAAVWYCVVQIICRSFGGPMDSETYNQAPLSTSEQFHHPWSTKTPRYYKHPLAWSFGARIGTRYMVLFYYWQHLLMPLSITRVVHEISISYFT
jgi:hypothetical protein